MAKLYTFSSPAAYASDTTMVSLGWEEYPAIDADDDELAAPNFRTSGASIIHTFRSGQVIPPRLVYRLGSAVVRGEVRIKYGQQICVLMSDDARTMLRVDRNFYNQSTHALEFSYVVDNVEDTGSFNYHVLFSPGEANGDTLATEVDFTWVVNGGGLEVYVQGKRCNIRRYSGGGYVTAVPIPTPLLGATAVGYCPVFTTAYAFPLVLRDNSDLIYCTSVTTERATVDTNRMLIGGTCTISGAVAVQVDVTNDEGVNQFHGSASIVGGVWAIPTSAIEKAAEPCSFTANINGTTDFTVVDIRNGALLEGHVLVGVGFNPGARVASQLSGPAGGPGVYRATVAAAGTALTRPFTGNSEYKLSITNIGGVPETREVFFQVPRCLVRQPVRIGNNNTEVGYYKGFWPFVDLAKAVEWRTSGSYILDARADPDHFNPDNGFLPAPPVDDETTYYPASLVNMAPNGSPRKFPDNDAIDLRSQLPWYAEPGEYVMDWRQAPNLPFSFFGTAGCVTTDLNAYGTGLHRVTITTPDNWIPADGGSGWGILLHRDNAKPNKGMPTVEWSFSIRKVGAEAGVEWSEGFLGWMRQSGLGFYRWMSGFSREVRNLPRNLTTDALRTKLTDQSWCSHNYTRPEIPFELIVDLHNRAGQDYWQTIPRTADETYIRAWARHVCDYLAPTIMIIWTLANEVWNFFQSQMISYYADGLARGLGKGRLATATIVDDSAVINISTALYGRVEVGQRIIGPGIQDGTTIIGFGTGEGRTGTYIMSHAATADATIEVYYDAPLVGGDGDYDYSDAREWYEGIEVEEGEIIVAYRVFRALSSFTSTVNPNTTGDWTNYELVQDGDLAAWRAHAEHISAVEAILRDEMGDAFYDARCKLVVERWGDPAQFGRSLAPYLDWGDLRGKIDAVATATYYGNSPHIFEWDTASAATRTATATLTGAARRAAWVQAAKDDAIRVVGFHRINARTHVDMCEARGIPEGDIEFWTYEGGREFGWNFSNAALASGGYGPIDQAVLREDFFDFMESDQEVPTRALYEGAKDVCGGHLSWFDSFSPTRHSSFFPVGFVGGVFFGDSQDVYDRADTSSVYRTLRDLSTEFGGVELPEEPVTTRRRRQVLILS